MTSSNHQDPPLNSRERRGVRSTPPDLGAKLRRAREAKGVSLQQISSATKIAIGALDALEQNAFSRLPGGLFTRAFIRSYAAEVGLDPEEAVRDFLAHPGSAGRGDLAAGEAVEDDGFRELRYPAALTLALLLLVFLSIGGLAYYMLAPSVPAPEQAGAPAAPVAAVPQTPVPLTPASPDEPLPAPTTGAVESRDRDLGSAPDTLTVELATTAPCWIAATVDGRFLFARTLTAGDRDVLEARREIVLRIGNAGALAYRINGRPGRSLGAAGEVVLVRISADTLQDFIEP